MISETMECPLCLGEGKLKRTEILDRLGVKDFARVAQLSAEEAFRLLQQKHEHDERNVWLCFETEIQRVRLGFEDKLRAVQSQKEDLNRRVEDYLREMDKLRERNEELEIEMAKVARIGRREEANFADEAQTWPGICIERLTRNGDFLLAYRDPSGAPLEPRIVVDSKDKVTINEGDIRKLIRDAKERRCPVGIIITREESQLRQIDRDRRWSEEDAGVWILRTTRAWVRRDLDVLRPMLVRMGANGDGFLQTNSVLAEEIRRTFVDLDEIEKELKKAAKAVDVASGLTVKYRVRVQALCDGASVKKKASVG